MLNRIKACYEVVLARINSEPAGPFDLLLVRDPDTLLDRIDPEEFKQDERLPYWAELWPASVALAGYLSRYPLDDSSITLELGSGLGLAGIAAARAGGRILLTDYERDALDFAHYNAYLNGVTDRVQLQLLDWRNPKLAQTFTTIIGADILYETANHPFLLRFLNRYLEPGGLFLVSDPNRHTVPGFMAKLVKEGFDHQKIEEKVTLDNQQTRVYIHRLIRGKR